MDYYLSEKINALSLGAMVLVVFTHSHNEAIKFASGEMTGNQGQWVLFIEDFVSKGLSKIVAPMFFAISGFLFFKSYELSLSGVSNKFKSRFKTLVIPYLFWSAFGLLLFLVLQSIPWSKHFFTKELVTHFSFSKLLLTLVVDPIPYQLWFVRDLIMLVIFSPIIWCLTKLSRAVWLLVLAFLWMVSPKTFLFFSNEALLFFTLGCALALDQRELLTKKVSKFWSYCYLITWLVIVLTTTYLLGSHNDGFGLDLLNHLGSIAGLLCVWSSYDRLDHTFIEKYSTAFGYTFFIFVFHEPLLTILIKGLFFLLGKTDLTSLLIYVIAPLLAIAISMMVRFFLKRHAPRFYDFATGGR